MLGAWNGGAHLFADCVRTIREVPDEEASEYLSEKSIFFRGFLAWMTFPPMVLLAFGEPVLLVIIYASLGALFLPFLAITLLILLNSQRVAPRVPQPARLERDPRHLGDSLHRGRSAGGAR
jgi:hypothetical protein